jgi:hypothetical protein
MRVALYGSVFNSSEFDMFSEGVLYGKARVDWKFHHVISVAAEFSHWLTYSGAYSSMHPMINIGCKAFCVEIGPMASPVDDKRHIMFVGSLRVGVPWEYHSHG